MQKFDVLIIGGGMVGLTQALAIRKQTNLTVAIADTSPVSELAHEPDVRVSAINAASEQIFSNLDVWSLIQSQRAQPYKHMHVWDKAGYGKLEFDNTDVNKEQLGWIIENNVIRNALWDKAQADQGISFFTENKISSIGVGDTEVFASFDASTDNNQLPITAKLLIGADGAHSWVRGQMNIPMTFRDYDHHAIVATVKCQQGHQNTAWQVFLPTGPLALLPLFQSDLCSIVWSTSPEEAKRLCALSPSAFAKELTAASDGKLGNIDLVSERFTHPLTMRIVQNFIKDRVVLVGDAAHTIHPLAGQGVNLGLLDAASLAQSLAEMLSEENSKHGQWYSQKSLLAFARWRKSEASEMVVAMEAIKQIFTPQQPATKLLRGIGLTLLDNIAPVKQKLVEKALGLKSHLPSLAQKQP